MTFNLKSQEVIVIGAMSETRAIGLGDGMPWDVPEEYQHFVDAVENQCVIIGRRSFDIFGADFEAHTFVISRSAKIDNVTVCASLNEAINLARQHKKTIFIAGGKSIYELAIPLADRLLLSTIKGHHEGDVLFPEFNDSQWQIDSEQNFDRYVLRDYRKA